MNILGHLLPDSAILGIGELHMEKGRTRELINEFGETPQRYFFELHLQAHTTRIMSEWFLPTDKEGIAWWKERFFVVRSKVAYMRGLDASTHDDHVTHAMEIYNEINQNLNSLLYAKDHGQPDRALAERVFSDLQVLKDLACK